MHELEYGIQLLPFSRKRARIHWTITNLVLQYSNRILPVGKAEATQAAMYRAWRRQAGRSLEVGDALIAATAKVNGLVLATRNIRDFEDLGLELIDPWDSG